MGNLRPILIMGLLLLAYMMWVEWQKDYGPAPQPPAPEAQLSAEGRDVPAPGATVPGSGQAAPPADLPVPSAPTASPQDAAGQQIRTFKGEGDRQYLTGLKLGGERTLILVDRSASMLSSRGRSPSGQVGRGARGHRKAVGNQR